LHTPHDAGGCLSDQLDRIANLHQFKQFLDIVISHPNAAVRSGLAD
jgi:hypothetical protein